MPRMSIKKFKDYQKQENEAAVARKEGQRAYREGVPRNENPYSYYADGRDDHKADAWYEGHADAAWDD